MSMTPHIALQPVDTSANAVGFFIDRHAQGDRAAHAAIFHESGEVTYAQLAGTVNQACNYLLDLGVQPEQRVMVHLPDGPEWVVCFMAAIKIGAQLRRSRNFEEPMEERRTQ
jgi:acyl-coenzyme A synthetase/AMP-(fatty) acid ligase